MIQLHQYIQHVHANKLSPVFVFSCLFVFLLYLFSGDLLFQYHQCWLPFDKKKLFEFEYKCWFQFQMNKRWRRWNTRWTRCRKWRVKSTPTLRKPRSRGQGHTKVNVQEQRDGCAKRATWRHDVETLYRIIVVSLNRGVAGDCRRHAVCVTSL